MHRQGHHLATVLFDLDGTLVDFEAPTYRAVSAALADFGHDVAPEALALHRRAPTLVEAISAAADLDRAHAIEVYDRFERYMPAAQAETEPLEGAAPLLEALHADGATLAIVTARRRRSLGILIARLRWTELFAATVTADDAPLKP